MALSPKQREFVSQFLICRNATRAALASGYSPLTARQMGAENLSKPVIQAEIERRTSRHFEALDISAAHVLDELGRLAFEDKYIKYQGGLAAKAKALELLGRYWQLWIDKIVRDVTPAAQVDLRGLLTRMAARQQQLDSLPTTHPRTVKPNGGAAS